MDNDLKVLNLYAAAKQSDIKSFNNSVQSSYTVDTSYETFKADFEWLELMEGTIMYIDNILRNPNRFIVNEEEVVNVEKARRITVESIKHLARNTNLIQDIDKNGDVKPSKILNINKDENYNTYENRVIYTLIKNMQMFVEMRTKNMITSSFTKSAKKSEYHGATRVGSEAVDINVVMSSKANIDESPRSSNELTIEQRVEKLKLRIADLTRTDVYKMLDKLHVARIVPPIKKTNLILKNTNFQYAMKLWDYLQSYDEGGNKSIKDKQVYRENAEVKGMFDDVFLLNYLVVNSVDGSKVQKGSAEQKEIIERLTDNMITKIVEINSDLPMAELQKIIGDRIAVIRNKREASIEEVQQKFNVKIQSYVSKLVSFDFRS